MKVIECPECGCELTEEEVCWIIGEPFCVDCWQLAQEYEDMEGGE